MWFKVDGHWYVLKDGVVKTASGDPLFKASSVDEAIAKLKGEPKWKSLVLRFWAWLCSGRFYS